MKKRFFYLVCFVGLLCGLVVLNLSSASSEAKASMGIPDAKAGTFRAEQMSTARVKVAYEEMWDSIQRRLSKLTVRFDHLEVFIRGFK